MKRFLLSCFIFFAPLLRSDELPFTFFQPPPGWLMSDSTHFKDGIKIGFVQSERKIFTPAITLSLEKISCDEKTYIEAVHKNHRSDVTKTIEKLGLLQTKNGNAHLFQIDIKETWGKVRILQAILVKDGVAYIQTASCLREDYLKFHKELLKSFQSLSIEKDLLSTIEDKKEFEEKLKNLIAAWQKYLPSAKGKKEDLFQESSFKKCEWIPFTEYITQNDRGLGICWQILAIQSVKDKLMNLGGRI